MIEIGLGHYLTLAAIIFTIGIIGIFLNRKNIKRQSYFDQIQREKDSAVSLVEVESGKGVKLDD